MTTFLRHTVLPYCKNLLFNPQHASQLACLVVLGDLVLTQLIIRFIRYTEIDWETYMYHIELYQAGERNYTSITGPTGPLVYPAGHVYVHELLYNATNSGLDIPLAQQIYGILYTVSQALMCAIYVQSGAVPNWVLMMLPLSKRLHSIYVLRLFNDCWATVAAQAATLALGAGYTSVACIIFSLALSVKMSILLYMPALVIILVQQVGAIQAFLNLTLMLVFQIILGWSFLSEYPLEYLAGAFDFSREFLFKWTVNWRFMGEEIFLDVRFARILLAATMVTLLAFVHFKWVDEGLLKLIDRATRNVWRPVRRLSPQYITTVLFTSNLIGITFARSLHYQFYSWYAQQIPFLLWQTQFPLPMKIALLGVIEYAWNVFPSTNVSSSALLASNALLLIGIWSGWPNRGRTVAAAREDRKSE